MGRLRRIFRIRRSDRAAAERDMTEELRLHVALWIDRLVARGVPPDEAERRAKARLGGYERSVGMLSESARLRDHRVGRRESLAAVRYDVRLAMRRAWRDRGLTTFSIGILSLALSAFMTVFAVTNRLASPPSNVTRQDRVFRLWFGGPGGPASGSYFTSYSRAEQLGSSQTVATVAAYASARTMAFEAGSATGDAWVGGADRAFFETLGARPSVGRLFGADEESSEASRVVVVSDDFLTRYHLEVGKQIRIGGETYRIIGVTEPGFTGAEVRPVDAWLPLRTVLTVQFGDAFHDPEFAIVRVVARVNEEVTPPAAGAALTNAWLATVPAMPRDSRWSVSLRTVVPAESADLGDAARISFIIAGLAIALLLVALSNVAAMLCARALRHRHYTALRLALGVKRARLALEPVLDACVLVLPMVAIAIAIAAFAQRLVFEVLLPDVAAPASVLDGRTALLIAGVTVLAVAVLSGPSAVVALLTAPTDLLAARPAGSSRRAFLGRALVVSQLAIAVVLMVGAALFAQSSRNVLRIPLGFDPDGLLVVRLELPVSAAPRTMREAWRLASRTVRSLDGVEQTSFATSPPFGTIQSTVVETPNPDPHSPADTNFAFVVGVDSAYASTMRIHVDGGRFVRAGDSARASGAIVISNLLARAGWGKANPVGARVVIGLRSARATVVGVVDRVVDYRLVDRLQPHVYVPLAQWPQLIGPGEPDGLVMLVRTAGDPGTVSEQIQSELRRRLTGLAYPSVRPVADRLEYLRSPWMLGERMLLPLSALAFIIALAGIYALLDYSVTQRAGEWAIRAAMGATPRQLVLVVGRWGVATAATGIGIGLAIAAALAPRVSDLLFGLGPYEPIAYGAVGVAAALVACGAFAAPARRAGLADPIASLRSE